MESPSRVERYSWMSSVVVPSKAGDLVDWVADLVAAGTLESWPEGPLASPLPPDLVAMEAVSEVASEVGVVMVVSVVGSGAAIGGVLVAEEAALATKAAVALAAEVGMVVAVLPTTTVVVPPQ